MLKFFPTEEVKKINFEGLIRRKYAITNFGRLLSYEKNFEDGVFLKGTMTKGYRTFHYSYKFDVELHSKTYLIGKLVAEAFLKKTSKFQIYVIHLDHDKSNDRVGNLRWAALQEKADHAETSPLVIESRKRKIGMDGHKLTTTLVMRIKKRLQDPNRRITNKTLARQFGISEMQLYRIKSGENWGHVIV